MRSSKYTFSNPRSYLNAKMVMEYWTRNALLRVYILLD